MELTEKIETINSQLVNLFGINTVNGLPMWRVVWSEDQFEKRAVTTTDNGIVLLQPVVKEFPKYRHYIREKYILERLVLIPESQQNELPVTKLSYEPIWTFMDAYGNYLPPSLPAAKFVIDSLYAAMGKKSLASYKDPDVDQPKERHLARVEKLESELFGNETSTGDALAYGTGIVVPRNYDTTKES